MSDPMLDEARAIGELVGRPDFPWQEPAPARDPNLWWWRRYAADRLEVIPGGGGLRAYPRRRDPDAPMVPKRMR